MLQSFLCIDGKPGLMETMQYAWAPGTHTAWLKTSPVAKIWINNSTCRLENVASYHIPGKDPPQVLGFMEFIFQELTHSFSLLSVFLVFHSLLFKVLFLTISEGLLI